MNGVVGLVNIGHEITNIYILDDGIPVLTRDIPVGTRRFREDLQRERGQSAEEAERMLQGSGAGEIPEAFLQTRTEELAVGIERAGAFLQTASRSAGGISPDLPHRRRRADPAAQPGVGRPAPDSGAAGQPDREAAGGRRRVRLDAGGRGRPPADASDRSRSAFRSLTPTQGFVIR